MELWSIHVVTAWLGREGCMRPRMARLRASEVLSVKMTWSGEGALRRVAMRLRQVLRSSPASRASL